MNNCLFVTDAASGFGLIHCQQADGHKGDYKPPNSTAGPLIKKDAVWRKYEKAPVVSEHSSQSGVCPVCGGCTAAIDHDCPYPPCKCGGDPENVLPKEY
jgi:hypothetical protein